MSNVLSLFPSYLKWHYGRGAKETIGNMRNIVRIFSRWFSISILLRTLFAPWRRISDSHGSILNFENFFSTIVVNGLMRLIGFFIRTFTILVGLFVILLVLILVGFSIVVWVLLPIIIPSLFIISVLSLI